MTEKELHKLKRQEVLQLLFVQVREAEKLQKKLDETAERLQAAEGLCGRLKERLNEKDEQIEKLKERLNEKDAQIGKLKERLDGKDGQISGLKERLDHKDEQIHDLRIVLEELQKEKLEGLQEPGSIAEAALELSGIFEAAQKAADLYLESVGQLIRKSREDEA